MNGKENSERERNIFAQPETIKEEPRTTATPREIEITTTHELK